jgi:PAS domain S-box-containing protein
MPSDPDDRDHRAAVQSAAALLRAGSLGERDLAAEWEWLRITLASIGDAVISTDAAGRVTYLNPVGETLTGWPLADALGRPLGEVFHAVNERTREPVEDPALRAVRERRRVRLPSQTVLIARGGTERPVDDSAAPMLDEAGDPVGAVLVFRDVTEKRRSDEARARLAAIVETSDDAIVTKTLDSVIRTWNAGAERIFGYTAAEAVGRSITILIPPERLDEETEILTRLRRGERIDHYETVRVTKDGRRIDVSLTVSPLRDADGRVVGASKIARDVTARRLADEALKDEKRLVETLNAIGTRLAAELDLGKLLQAVTDETTRLTGAAFGAFFYNAVDEKGESYQLYTLSGVARAAFAGFPMPRNTAIFAPTFRGEGVVRLADVTADPRYGHNAPHRGMPAGHLPVCSYLAVPVKSRSGEVLGGLFFGHPKAGVFTDRHERLVVGVAAQAAVAVDNARLYERLREQDRRKDDFIALLAHELRNPLAPLRNGLELIRLSGDAGPAVVKARAMMDRQLTHMVRLIDDLLDVSRITRGKLHLQMGRVSLAEVVAHAVEATGPAIAAARHELTLTLPPEPVHLTADLTRLAQVFGNLLSNSAKYTQPGGRIWLTAEAAGGQVAVTVRDTGIGIPADALPHVFDMFAQVDRSAERESGGLGIGLALVKGLVEMHGGTVAAASEGAGRGSTFTVRLPALASYSESFPSVPQADEPRAAGPKHRVLVVDDNRDSAH